MVLKSISLHYQPPANPRDTHDETRDISLLACVLLMVANKTLCDSPFAANSWATFFKVPVKSLVALERFYLCRITWDVAIGQQVTESVIVTTRAWLKRIGKANLFEPEVL
jgi:hypothetical protein